MNSETSVLPSGSASYRWLIAAVLLYLLQVIPYLSYRWVTDESWYAGPAYSIAHGQGIKDPAIGPNDLENHFDARPPGTALVIAVFFKVFGAGQIAARMGSVLAGLFSVFLVYLLTRDLFGDIGAMIAMLLTASDNLIVLTARTARPEALTVMAVLLALLACKQYWLTGTRWWALSCGLLIAAGTMFHITVLGFVLSLCILVVWSDLDEKRGWLGGVMAYGAGFVAGLAPFAMWILTAPLGRKGFHQEYLNRAVGESLTVKLIHEGHRYSDILGLNMVHGHGLESVPLRLPIPLFFLAASYLLYRFKRTWFYLEMVLFVPTLLWFIDTANKSSRYIAILAPFFAMAIGAAVFVSRRRPKLDCAGVWLAGAIIAAQIGANVFLLRAARKADYTKVGRELSSVIPAGETAYGTITFWLALRDHPYISYERTDPWMAVRDYHVRYLIVGDRMMTLGNAWDADFDRTLHEHLAQVTAQSELVGEFPDPYYGDLKVFRLKE